MHEKELGVSEHGGVRDVDDGDGRTDGRNGCSVFTLQAEEAKESERVVRLLRPRSVRPSVVVSGEGGADSLFAVRLSPFDDARYATATPGKSEQHLFSPRRWRWQD